MITTIRLYTRTAGGLDKKQRLTDTTTPPGGAPEWADGMGERIALSRAACYKPPPLLVSYPSG